MKEIKYIYYYRGTKRTKNIALTDVCEAIQEEKFHRQCSLLAERTILMGKNMYKETENDEKLPLLVFGMDNDNRYTGYVVMSFKCPEYPLLEEKRRIASLAPQTLMAFASAAATSLIIVVAFTLPEGDVPTDTNSAACFNQYAYHAATLFYRGLLGLELDMKSPSINRSCQISIDPKVYLNVNVVPMIQEQPMIPFDETVKKNLQHNIPAQEGKIMPRPHAKDELPGYNEYLMDITRFQFCYSVTTDENHPEMDEFIISLAAHCQRNGIGQEFAAKRLMMFSPFNDYATMIRRTFHNVYSQSTNQKEQNIPQITVEMRRMVEFLNRRYRLRRNAITGSAEYIEEGMYMFDWKPLTKEIINRMTICAIDEGISIWDKDIKRYLESTFVYEYDPVFDYLYSLPAWDRHDRVSEMAQRVPTKNPDWVQNFHTWMLSMVSQWLGRDTMHGSTMVPLLVGNQGDGKSTFCKMILPPELHEYYTDRLDFTNRNEAERALTRFALINIDEFDSITKRQGAFLKHILQKSSVMSRKLYQSVIAEQKRYASFIGTTNDPSPLTDPTGSRRYLCIRTNGIIDTTDDIDYQQLYAQVKHELSNGEKSYFTGKEEAKIQQQNAAFEEFDMLFEIFSTCYCKPEAEEKGVFIGVADILHCMHKASLAVKEDRVTMSKLGKMLKQNDFEFKHTKAGNKYLVVTRADEI
jgi:hypothetical protein